MNIRTVAAALLHAAWISSLFSAAAVHAQTTYTIQAGPAGEPSWAGIFDRIRTAPSAALASPVRPPFAPDYSRALAGVWQRSWAGGREEGEEKAL